MAGNLTFIVSFLLELWFFAVSERTRSSVGGGVKVVENRRFEIP
jgi:hypothetical protein